MKRKGLMILLAAALLLCLLPGSAPTASAMSGEYVIMTATDLHFLAPELTDHGSYFWKVMDNSDGRVTEYCEEITDAFLAQVIRQAPDALVLTGDISFNGARASHMSLAAKLADVEAAGIPVFVLPGNHDVYRGTAAAFFGDGYELMPGVSGEEFAEIYGEFGFDEALSRDQDSLSYVSRLNDSTWLLMLDANTLHDYCSLSQKTLAWTREQLEAARLGGVGVLAACHQNLYQHSVFRGGYMLACSEQLHDLLEEYQVPLILSGHMHIQQNRGQRHGNRRLSAHTGRLPLRNPAMRGGRTSV